MQTIRRMLDNVPPSGLEIAKWGDVPRLFHTATARLLLLITIFALAIGSASPSRLRADSKPAVEKKTLLYYYLCDQKKFRWTWEDVYRPGRRVFSYGMGSMKVIPPPANATVGQAVRFLKPQLPDAKIWRDAVNRGIVHFADRRVLRWSRYPLNKKLTFHGIMSFLQLKKRVLRRLVPAVHFFGPPIPPGAYGMSGGIPIWKSNLLRVVTYFNEKEVSLRRFLTTDIRYRGGFNQDIWEANAYEAGNGTFTGRVDIYFVANPKFTPAATQPGKKKK